MRNWDKRQKITKKKKWTYNFGQSHEMKIENPCGKKNLSAKYELKNAVIAGNAYSIDVK